MTLFWVFLVCLLLGASDRAGGLLFILIVFGLLFWAANGV